MTMSGRFAFLPSVRTRVAAEARHRDGQRRSLSYDLEIAADGAAQGARLPVAAQLRGPGDIIAVDRAQIARIEPAPGLRTFEPSYFPFVEFADPDFPWRYSLDPGGSPRPQPWLVLVALQPEEFELVDQGRAPLPAIRVLHPDASLPDLAQAWAFAAAQVDLPTDTTVHAADILRDDPGRGFSRLLCPRKLEPRRSYFLFLVPTYQAGVDAGLGRPNGAAPFDQRAWLPTATAPLTLPFYHQSRFQTDSADDLEGLVRRLRPASRTEMSGAAAPRFASSARPGYYPGYSKRGARFELQTALQGKGAVVPGFDTDPTLAGKMKQTLDEVIQGEGTEGPNAEDPLVAFPPYGFRFRQEREVLVDDARKSAWFDRVNLDLKMRQAASLGAQTVQENQELFAKLCWDQYEEIAEANRRLARLQAAQALVQRIHEKHFAPLDHGLAFSLAEPLHPFVASKDGVTPVGEVVRQSGAPASFASRGLRRVAARRPRLIAGAGATGRHEIPAPAIPGDLTAPPRKASPRAQARSAGILKGKGVAGALGTAMQAVLGAGAFTAQSRPRTMVTEVRGFSSLELADAVRATVAMLPAAKASAAIGGLRTKETPAAAIAPIWRSPEVPLPLSRYLTRLSAGALIGNPGALPPNSVSLFQENRHFVEAFLVGANHAMNDELRWREFPTDMRGTIFRRFWDRGRDPADTAGDDIASIHTWSGQLGRHHGPAPRTQGSNLVVVIKGDVVRKIGQSIVVLNEGTGGAWQSGSGTDHEPIFFGSLGVDTVYYGFDVPRDHFLTPSVRDRSFLVIYEPMGRLRFGLDVGSAAVRAARKPDGGQAATTTPPLTDWDELSWSHMNLAAGDYVDFERTLSIPHKADLWGSTRTSASLARSFWQKPLAAVLPLKRVL
jgi:hypothetical protein